MELKQLSKRVGRRGEVHDIYELLLEDKCVLVIRHYIEYGLDEVPLNITVVEPNVDVLQISSQR